MAKYIVTGVIKALVDIVVDADSELEALEKANKGEADDYVVFYKIILRHFKGVSKTIEEDLLDVEVDLEDGGTD